MAKYPKNANCTTELKKILSLVTFAKSCINFDWGWEVEEVYEKEHNFRTGDSDAWLKGWLINTTFSRPDIDTGKIGRGKGRQIYIAMGTSASSIFFSCVVCVKLIVEHEWMEAIRFDGQKVLNPHRTLDELSMPDILVAHQISIGQFNNFVDHTLCQRELKRVTKGLKPISLRELNKRPKSAFKIKKARR